MSTIHTSVHRVVLPITDTVDVQLAGFRRALHAAPVRPHILDTDPDRDFELWYEVATVPELFNVRVHVEGTGHQFDHRGEYVSTMSTADGHLIWHVYVEYPVMADA